MKIKTFTMISSFATLLLLSILLVVVFHARDLQKENAGKENQRSRALLLANELLQSTEDLTRMARTYVITGNPDYERYFYEILEIREGKRPRPRNYSTTYWHLAGVGKAPNTSYEEARPLLELMRREGLSAEELALIKQSTEKSNALAAIEKHAFAAMKGIFDDGSGSFLIRRAPDRDFATKLLYSEEYVNSKAEIMAPLEKFVVLLEERTKVEIDFLHDQLRKALIFEILLVLCILIGILVGILYMYSKILKPLLEIGRHTNAIANGKYEINHQILVNNELFQLSTDINTMVKTIVDRNANRDKLEKEQKKYSNELKERVKELQCLYRLSDLGQNDSISSAHFFDHAVNLLPQALRYPDTTCARIIFDEKTHQSGIYIDSQLKITAPISLQGIERGRIEIIYTGENNACDPFLPEERQLLKTIADQIPQIIGRRISEEALQDSTIRLSAILDNVVDGIITIDETGKIKSFNKSAVAIFGYEVDEIVEQNIKELMPELNHSEHESYFNHYQTIGEKKIAGVSRQVMGRRKDGSNFPIDLAVSEMRIGNDLVYTGIVRDITQRKLVEDKLQETLSLTNAILGSANFSIISINLDGFILSFNSAAERMLGYQADDVIGKLSPINFHDSREIVERASFLTEETGKVVEPNFNVLVAKVKDGAPDEGEWTYLHKDKHSFPVLLSVTVLKNSRDQVTGYLMVASDISERKKIEKMKNEFVSTVSHELRTPLTSIRGSLGLIVGGMAKELSPKVQTLVEVANKNCERLILLVNDILDMEKIEAGKISFLFEVKELRPLLLHAIEANQGYADQFKVSYILEDVPDVAFKIDVNRFMQVFANLLSNAAKFSAEGGVVCIAAEYRGEMIRIMVSDNGRGISKDYRSQIFDKFSQGDSSDTRKKGGTGLGLAITKKLVEKMNGSIGFDSQPDVLTTFFIEFPIFHQVVNEAEEMVVRDDHYLNEKVLNKRVLICEDDKDVAAYLKLLLEKQVHLVDVAYDAKQAKKMLVESKYDLMTLDLVLPGQSGIELINELRATEATRDLPVVMISVTPSDSYVDHYNASAFRIVDWITKPVEKDELHEAISRAVTLAAKNYSRILHVEDDEDILLLVKELIGNVADLDQATTLRDAKDLINLHRYDLVILDINLPEGSGLDLLPTLDNASPPIPVLIFSSEEVEASKLNISNTVLVKSMTDNIALLRTIKKLIRL